MRKNLFALAIAGILAVSTMAPTMVSAAAPQQDKTVPVSYKYQDSTLTFDGFTVTVPSGLYFTSDKKTIDSQVDVTLLANRQVGTDKAIKLSVNSAKQYKLESDAITGDKAPVYQLKYNKLSKPGNWDSEGTLVTQNDAGSYVDLGSFTDADFGTDASSVGTPTTKNLYLNAKITKDPVDIGSENVEFKDTLTFRVAVGSTL